MSNYRMDLTSLRKLSDLPANLFLQIRDHLDISYSPNQGWRALVANLDGRFTMCRAEDFERSTSPTTELFIKLRSRDMTVQEFISCAIAADDHFIMDLFGIYVQAEIVQNPLNEMNVLEGETVDIMVKAKGFPLPKYQWYKNNFKIKTETGNILRLYNVSKSDEGEYYCAVYNHDDLSKLAISSRTVVYIQPAPPLEIKEHPQSCMAYIGGSATFKCEVWCTSPLSYQWYKDESQLEDGVFIQGSTSSKLRLGKIDSLQWEGNYYCEISRPNELTGIFTQIAVLKIPLPAKQPRSIYTATDKVALLIGCYDYRSDRLLTAPRYDVQTLSSIFQSINFKVVSLLNLTKSEMIAAVDEFQKLVWKGVYCVFYFCGHGYEISNQCYLVPVDAPCLYQYQNTDCIAADFIFNSLLKQEPQICCMILDICRTSIFSYDMQATIRPLRQQTMEKGNAIVCYGTSFGLAAYESRNYGILVYHLKNILGQPLDIESVFRLLREAINEDPKLNNNSSEKSYKQIPEIRTNLLEVGRSFTDQIMYSGHTAVFNAKTDIWESAHKKPDSINLDVQFEQFVVKIRLDFQQEFSNVLKIYTSVIDPGPTSSCVAYVSGVPAEVAEKAKVKTISTGQSRLKKNYVVIHNIQRLKKPMKINVTVLCQSPESQKTIEVNNLGLPLIAKLNLWKERPSFLIQRFAEEVTSETS